jgi:alcohol dehydrogenase
MKALVYRGPGSKAVEDRPKPAILSADDAIIRVTHTTICGTDLHILKGDVPTCESGRILGHEGVGIVESVGPSVTRFKRGDRVLISCITACGKCDYCRRGMYSHCETGGWILGHRIDGTQAEFVRIPHADTSLYPLKNGVDPGVCVMLSDVIPTAFECGVLNGKLEDPGINVAVVGAGPIGLATVLTAQFFSPGKIIVIDRDLNRLAEAKRLGATDVIDAKSDEPVAQVLSLTGGVGADAVIEAVGTPEAFALCQEIVAPGGRIANIGVHGKKVDLHLEKLWSQNIAITTRLVDTVTTHILLKALENGKLSPAPLISHHFDFGDILGAYDTFERAPETHALKVLIAVP